MSEKLAPLVWQAVALALCWAVLVGPAVLLVGATAVVGVSYAAMLCFIPTALLLLKAAVNRTDNPLVDVVLGMGMRMAVVLGGAWLICAMRPELDGPAFLYWLIPLYCVALVVETRQALNAESHRKPVGQSAHGG